MSVISTIANKIAALGPTKTEKLVATLEAMSEELKNAGVFGPIRNDEDAKWVERERKDFVRSATRHAVEPYYPGDLELTYRATNIRVLVDFRTNEKNEFYVRSVDAVDHPFKTHVDFKTLDAKLKEIASL